MNEKPEKIWGEMPTPAKKIQAGYVQLIGYPKEWPEGAAALRVMDSEKRNPDRFVSRVDRPMR